MRKVAAVLAVSGVMPTAGAVAARPAAADLTTVSCLDGQQAVTYAPGINNTARTVATSVSEDYSCGLLGPVSSASTSFTVTEDADCRVSLNMPDDVTTYRWNSPNGSSTINFSRTTVTRAADGTSTVISVGKVTSGLGAGQIATRTVILPELDLAECGSPRGVTHQVGPATLVIAPV